jgi:hypothetical protein
MCGPSVLAWQGRSSSFFCHSADNKFIMKTVSPKEALSLVEMLPKYLQHLTYVPFITCMSSVCPPTHLPAHSLLYFPWLPHQNLHERVHGTSFAFLYSGSLVFVLFCFVLRAVSWGCSPRTPFSTLSLSCNQRPPRQSTAALLWPVLLAVVPLWRDLCDGYGKWCASAICFVFPLFW